MLHGWFDKETARKEVLQTLRASLGRGRLASFLLSGFPFSLWGVSPVCTAVRCASEAWAPRASMCMHMYLCTNIYIDVCMSLLGHRFTRLRAPMHLSASLWMYPSRYTPGVCTLQMELLLHLFFFFGGGGGGGRHSVCTNRFYSMSSPVYALVWILDLYR